MKKYEHLLFEVSYQPQRESQKQLKPFLSFMTVTFPNYACENCIMNTVMFAWLWTLI
ncbi:Uncharacterised protein [Clostridioides difficile]|nr:Uncharacterised protein [Clostridioides difficile]